MSKELPPHVSALAQAGSPPVATGAEPCRRHPEWFFSEREEEIEAAKNLCASCPMLQQCHDWAATAQPYGVWGGTDDFDRFLTYKPGAKCSNGHVYSRETLARFSAGRVHCKICKQVRENRNRARKTAERAEARAKAVAQAKAVEDHMLAAVEEMVAGARPIRCKPGQRCFRHKHVPNSDYCQTTDGRINKR
jgi:hypothetical protein